MRRRRPDLLVILSCVLVIGIVMTSIAGGNFKMDWDVEAKPLNFSWAKSPQ